jgi:hypothetical protein
VHSRRSIDLLPFGSLSIVLCISIWGSDLGHKIDRISVCVETAKQLHRVATVTTKVIVSPIERLGLALALVAQHAQCEAVAAHRAVLEEMTRARAARLGHDAEQSRRCAPDARWAREGTARLEEAVAAFRAALEERTRDRVPLDWAMSTGNQGVALRVLAERRGDLTMAEQALAQISAAFEACRDARHAPNAAFYEAQLPAAQTLVDRLRKGEPFD